MLSDQQLQCSHIQHKYTVQSEMLKVKNRYWATNKLQCSHIQHKYTVQNKIKGTEGLI